MNYARRVQFNREDALKLPESDTKVRVNTCRPKDKKQISVQALSLDFFNETQPNYFFFKEIESSP